MNGNSLEVAKVEVSIQTATGISLKHSTPSMGNEQSCWKSRLGLATGKLKKLSKVIQVCLWSQNRKLKSRRFQEVLISHKTESKINHESLVFILF